MTTLGLRAQHRSRRRIGGPILALTVVTSAPLWAGANAWSGNGPLDQAWVQALAYVPTTPPAIIVALEPPLVTRSTDNGASWTPVTGIPVDGLSLINVIVTAPSNPMILFAYIAGEIFKSTDGGATWAAVGASGVDSMSPRSLAVAPSDASKVFAGTYNHGVYHSPDGGQTWLPSTTRADGRVLSLAVDPADPAIIYQGRFAFSADRVLKSTDGGATWSSAAAGLPAAQTVYSLAVDPSNSLNVYAASAVGVYKSVDGGGNWNTASTGLPAGVVRQLLFPTDAPGTLLATTRFALYRSTDGAATWAQVGASFSPLEPVSMAGVLSNIYVGTGGGVQRSTDAGVTFTTLQKLTTGLKAPVWVVRGDPLSSTTFFVGTNSGLWETTDDGQNWTDATTNLPSGVIWGLFIFPGAPNVRLVSTDAGIFRSTDFGATWNATDVGWGGGPLVADPFQPDTTVYGGSSNGALVSTNQGITWSAYATGGANPVVGAIAPDPKTPGLLFAGSGGGDGVYKSLDWGHTWASSGIWPAGSSIFTLAVDPFDSQIVYAAGGVPGAHYYDLRKSTDGGASWSVIVVPGPGARDTMIDEIVPDPLARNKIFLGTDSGVFVTADAGATWFPVNVGLPVGSTAQSFELHPGDRKKYVLGNISSGGGWSYTADPAGNQVVGGGSPGGPSDVGTWTPTGAGTASFSTLSADGSGGSVLVAVGASQSPSELAMGSTATNGAGDGVQQACTPIDARYTYSLGGKLYIPSGQAQTGSGKIVMSWYSDAMCTQYLSATGTPPVSGAPFDAWRGSSLVGIHPPAGAVRSRIGLSVTKNEPEGSFSVNFDDVTFATTCDGAAAAVGGGGIIARGGSTTIQALLTGLAPWTLTWSDGLVATTSVSPAVRTVSPTVSTAYSVVSVSDGLCTGSTTGSAVVEIQQQITVPTLGSMGLLALALALASVGASFLVRARSGG